MDQVSPEKNVDITALVREYLEAQDPPTPEVWLSERGCTSPEVRQDFVHTLLHGLSDAEDGDMPSGGDGNGWEPPRGDAPPPLTSTEEAGSLGLGDAPLAGAPPEDQGEAEDAGGAPHVDQDPADTPPPELDPAPPLDQ
ncbi:MAG: hypothetical protein JXX28_19355, partial [Deltaproteobacteria bacterium]|nr:hypothetical protein [Deltaproteobacteria bacterium]